MLKIREAELKDFDIIIELFKEYFRDHEEIIHKKNPKLKNYPVFKSNTLDMLKEYVKKLIKGRKYTVHLVEDNGTVIAFSNLVIKKEIPIYQNKEFGLIDDLYVRGKYRGKKISSMLYAEARKWFKSKGIRIININVRPENERAHSIYRHWGFFDFSIDMRNKI